MDNKMNTVIVNTPEEEPRNITIVLHVTHSQAEVLAELCRNIGGFATKQGTRGLFSDKPDSLSRLLSQAGIEPSNGKVQFKNHGVFFADGRTCL